MMSFPRTHQSESDLDRDIEVSALLSHASDIIAETLEREGITRKELAGRLGVSPAHVTQMLAGGRNLTLKSVAETLYAMGHRAELSAVPLGSDPEKARASLIRFVGKHIFHHDLDSRLDQFLASARGDEEGPTYVSTGEPVVVKVR